MSGVRRFFIDIDKKIPLFLDYIINADDADNNKSKENNNVHTEKLIGSLNIEVNKKKNRIVYHKLCVTEIIPS